MREIHWFFLRPLFFLQILGLDEDEATHPHAVKIESGSKKVLSWKNENKHF
jgi:hypothetical protein